MGVCGLCGVCLFLGRTTGLNIRLCLREREKERKREEIREIFLGFFESARTFGVG